MRSLRTARKRPTDCIHDETVANAVAGIERVVCQSCGHVSVRHSGESVTRAGAALSLKQADLDSGEASDT